MTSPSAYNGLSALYNCSNTVLCYSIAAFQHFLMHFHYFQLLLLCRIFCSISSCVRVSLYYLMLFFLPSIYFCPASLLPLSYMKHFLIHCFIFPVVLHPMTHCTGNLSCLLRIFWRADSEVWRERGVGQIRRGLEGDKIYACFKPSQLMLLKITNCSYCFFYSVLSPRNGSMLSSTPP